MAEVPYSEFSQKLQSFAAAHSQIIGSIEKLGNLKDEYQAGQQQKFMKAVMNVMDRLSDQYSYMQDKIRKIDEEIAAKRECRHYEKELQFFKAESVVLRRELTETQEQIQAEKSRKMANFVKKQHLQSSMRKEVKRSLKNELSEKRRSVSQGTQRFQGQKFSVAEQSTKENQKQQIEFPKHTNAQKDSLIFGRPWGKNKLQLPTSRNPTTVNHRGYRFSQDLTFRSSKAVVQLNEQPTW